MPHAVDFLRDSKLDTKFFGHDTLHVSYRSLASNQQRNTRVDERWTRKRKIGGGTYGQVWLESCSEGPRKGDLRAVKEISKAQATVADTDYTRELEAITKFSEAKYVHCFVQSFGWYESDDSIYIAMEYIEHGDLQKQLTRSFPDFEVQSIASQILQGLQFMHENGFTHRDLKPSNILVLCPSPEWWVKIGDFGITKKVEEGSTSLKTLIGTKGYLAPEINGLYPKKDGLAGQIEKKSYTSAVDIWALGEICFKLITNRPAFPTTGELVEYVVLGHDFPRASLLEANASTDCVNFIEMMMSAEAATRPSASDGLMCGWMKTTGKTRSGSQPRLKKQQSHRVSLKSSQTFEATAVWTTPSGSLRTTPVPSALVEHTRDFSDYPKAFRKVFPELQILPEVATPMMNSSNTSSADSALHAVHRHELPALPSEPSQSPRKWNDSTSNDHQVRNRHSTIRYTRYWGKTDPGYLGPSYQDDSPDITGMMYAGLRVPGSHDQKQSIISAGESSRALFHQIWQGGPKDPLDSQEQKGDSLDIQVKNPSQYYTTSFPPRSMRNYSHALTSPLRTEYLMRNRVSVG